VKLFKSKKTKFFLLLTLFLVGAGFIVFNEYGVLKYLKLKNELNSINEKIDQTEQENKKLEAEVDSLEKKVPAKIEETAREKYHMKREGEESIRIIEK
jgi:cell division protein FtsL